jgi:radical SAM superfamily enzyme YgiQ (UPF0313 family)
MKVLLLQLPVPNNRFINLPLALGYLKASADAIHLPELEISILERNTQDKGGDAFLLDEILRQAPDLVGFSLYSWNSARALNLAHSLKIEAPEMLLLGGGPEANRDNAFIMIDTPFDYLVFGEGERTFVELLQHLTFKTSAMGKINGLGYKSTPGLLINPPRSSFEDVNHVPSAYLNGALEHHLGKFMFIELSRWCPSKCTFCYYGRQDLPFGGKRYFDINRIRAELEFGLARGVEQVHFVEANFNTLPHLDQIYRTITETGANRQMRFYAEMRGEAIDKYEADRLAACNFGVIEVGLQSAVPEVLAKVRRKNHLPRLVQGVQTLRERGIEVFLDAILGLPGDTSDTFHRTLDFIESNRLEPYDLFHLQVLSGTQLKTEVENGQHAILYQSEPPYFVQETSELPFETLCNLREETLKRKGDDPDEIAGLPITSPFALCEINIDAESGATGPLEKVVLNHKTAGEAPELARQLASVVTIIFEDLRLEEMEKALASLSLPNPTSAWHIFVRTALPLNSEEVYRLAKAVHHQTGYLDRLAIFAYRQADPAKFKIPPTIKIYNLLDWHSEIEPLEDSYAVWIIELKEEESAGQWRKLLENALGSEVFGIYVKLPSGFSLEKLQSALVGLETGKKQIWWNDITVAAGYSRQEPLPEYPVSWQRQHRLGCSPEFLNRARLRWELTRRKSVKK